MNRPSRAVPPARPGEHDLAIDPEWTSRILEGFVRSEVGRTGHSRVVVGLSGGLDSTVAAYVATRAIGPGSVFGILLPHRTSSPGSLLDAERVVGELGILAEKVDITPMVEGFERAAGRVGRVRLGNVMARARMVVLYDRSVEHRALVLGTSNKTEILLGYGTLHGDMASAVNPLGDLFKTQVRALGAWLKVPRNILAKTPTADLWPTQSDEAELGFAYEQADRLLALLVDARVSRKAAIEAGFPPRLVDRVMRRVVATQYKRRPPLVAKVSMRTVGWDFRYPRDWKT